MPHDGRPACRQLGFCAAGCVIGAKWSAFHAEIPHALASGHCELREQAMAVASEHDGAAPPALTVVALALRQADYLTRALRAGEL